MTELAEDVAAQPVRVIGMPGPFAEWGLTWVREILQGAGVSPQIVPLGEAAGGWRVGFGYEAPEDPFTGRTLVFLDTLAAALEPLAIQHRDTLQAARHLSSVLARLSGVLRSPGALVIRRAPDMDKSAVRGAIAEYLAVGLPHPDEALACEASFDPTAPDPTLGGYAQVLLRQVLAPMLAFAEGGSDPIVWPLCSFFSGDHIGELAPPIIETQGPARFLYYGPFFNLPAGEWRMDLQLFFPNDVPDSRLTADIFGAELLTEVDIHPRHAGLFEATVRVAIPRARDPIQLRVRTKFGTLSGHLGLRQVTLRPISPAEPE